MVILAENSIMSFVIGMVYDNYSRTLMTVIWVCYLLGFIMKIIFYIGLHPWSELVRNDLKKTWGEWQRPIDGKGCWDQFKAGLRVEWNICYKTEPGKYEFSNTQKIIENPRQINMFVHQYYLASLDVNSYRG